MSKTTWQLKVNGQVVGKCNGNIDTPREKFVDYVKKIQEFDESKDILEIEEVKAEPKPVILRHSARDKARANAYIDGIIDRHLKNIIATYGEEKLLKLLKDTHGLMKVS